MIVTNHVFLQSDWLNPLFVRSMTSELHMKSESLSFALSDSNTSAAVRRGSTASLRDGEYSRDRCVYIVMCM